jgi:hypothetical protein
LMWINAASFPADRSALECARPGQVVIAGNDALKCRRQGRRAGIVRSCIFPPDQLAPIRTDII